MEKAHRKYKTEIKNELRKILILKTLLSYLIFVKFIFLEAPCKELRLDSQLLKKSDEWGKGVFSRMRTRIKREGVSQGLFKVFKKFPSNQRHFYEAAKKNMKLALLLQRESSA